MKNGVGILVIILTLTIFLIVTSTGMVFSQTANQTTSSNVGYYKIPSWIKNNAKWWADGSIGDDDFLKGTEYLINQAIIVLPPNNQLATGAVPQGIPVWIKNNAKLWADGSIGDDDFVKGIQFLVANEIIHVNMKSGTQCTAAQYFDAASNRCVQVTTPSPPQNLQAGGGNTTVSLLWQTPSSTGGSSITGYKIYKSTSSGAETFLATVGNVTSYSDLELTNGVTYFYKVTALNSIGESVPSSEANGISATTSSYPQNLLAVGGNAKISLSWQAPSSNGGSSITGYKIYRSTISGIETPLTTVGTVLWYNDTGVAIGAKYYYKVTAINSVGESARSSEASVTTSALPSVTPVTVQPSYHLVFFLQSTSAPLSYSANLNEFATNLKPGDILFVSGSPKANPSTILQQTLSAKAAVGPGVKVYSLKFYFTMADITANATKLPKGFDYIGYDYEKGINYSPEFTASEATSIGYFDQAQAIVKQYNTATGSNAKFMVTPPYGELQSANWDWGLAAKHMDTINMQMQSLILDPNYQGLVTSVVSQIRQGSPNTELFVQVSISRDPVPDNVNAINMLKILPIEGILVFYQNNQTSDLQQLFNSLNR